MDFPSEYDIFEITADGTPIWRSSVLGEGAALAEMETVAKTSDNEIIVVHLSSGVVVARRAPKVKPATAAASRSNGDSPGSNHQ